MKKVTARHSRSGWIGMGLLCAGMVGAQPSSRPAQRAETPAALEAEIKTLQAPHVAWREIAWKSCLLDGLKESRSQGKPALLWIFIDRPADDERC